jgi:ABC-type branched-subunit amino acid transport system ATPase component
MSGDGVALRVEQLVAGYGGEPVLRGISLHVRRGGIVSVIGPNGSGKSTLLKAIYGLVPERRGGVVVDGEHDLLTVRPHAVTRLGVNYVPQLRNVFPNLTVLENLEVGGLRDGADAARRERVFEWFPVLRARRRQRAGTLSGGERQMLAIGRALMTDPRLLLLDEPLAGVGPRLVEEVLERLVEMNRAGISLLIVEQNARRTLAVSDYAYVLDGGQNRGKGTGRALLEDPAVAVLYLGGRSADTPLST